MTKSTHILEQRKIHSSLKQQVQSLLDWDDLQFGEFQYQCGLDYLKYYMPQYPAVAEQLTRSKTFWNWWKNSWSRRDEQFVTGGIELVKIDTRMDIYRHLHDPKTLAYEIYPNGVVLGHSYKNMMQTFIDTEMHAL